LITNAPQFEESSMPTLHGASLSPFVRKVRVALAIKGIEYEQIQIVPFGANEDFKRISPLGKIPVYEDQGQMIPDSSVM
jgi:glutathione S-transferase